MRSFATLFAALLLFATSFSSAQATSEPRATAKPADRKASVAARPAAAAPRPAAPARITTGLIAPTRNVLHTAAAATIVGTVTNAQGEPLVGATIWKTNTREILAVTNSQGDYLVTLPNNAPIGLTFGFEGYEPAQRFVSEFHQVNQYVVNLQPSVVAKKRR